jgi:hypothetical protein
MPKDTPQVQAYASEWEETFGYKVKEAGACILLS